MRSALLLMAVLAALVCDLRAQDGRVSRDELLALKGALNRVMAESVRLKDERERLLGAMPARQAATDLESRINVLLQEAPSSPHTLVNSEAGKIRIFGEFRARWGATWDRDFGNAQGGVFGAPLTDVQEANGGLPLETEDDDGTYLEARFRVGFDFEFSRDITTRFVLTSYGLLGNGDTPGSGAGPTGGASPGGGAISGQGARSGFALSNNHTLDDVELYEGWIRIDRVFGVEGLSLTNGRQEIVLGNEFQFGDNEFFSGETHDAARLRLVRDTYSLDFIWARLAISEDLNTRDHPWPSAGQSEGFDDDELFAVYFTYLGVTDHVLDIYWIYLNGDNGGSVGTLGNSLGSSSIGDNLKEVGFAQAYFHTFGLRLAGDFEVADGLDYNVEVAWQTGSLKDFSNTDIDGLAIEAEIGLTFDAPSRTRAYVRFLYAEGAHDGDSGYIPLFPERHAYDDGARGYRARYGLLDIIPMDNVITLQGGFSFDPAADWSAGLAVLWATHDADLAPIGTGDDDIGFEIDVFAEYRHSQEFTLTFGFGVFLPEEGAPFKNGGFVGDGGRDEPAFLGYIDARVIF